MTVTKKESESIRKFVCALLRDEADLGTLTIGVLKRRYLAHVGGDSLSSEAQRLIKEVVKKELVKMQDKDSKTEFETRIPSQKRKRENVSDDEGTGSEAEDESSAKKSHQSDSSGSSSESKDRISKSENAKKESAKRKQKKKNKISSDESEDDKHTGVQAGSKSQVSSEDSDEDKPNNSKKKSDKTKGKTHGLTKNSQVSGDKSENDRQNKHRTQQMDKTKQRTDETSRKEVSNDQMDFEAGPAKKKTNTASKEQVSSDDSEHEEKNKSDSVNAKKSNIQSSGTSKEEQMSSDDSEDEETSEGQSKQKLKETPQSENEDDSDHPEKIDKNDDSSSADSEKENVSREKDQETDSDSSSLLSLEDETEYKRKVKEKDKVTKKKTVEKKEKTTKRKTEENKSVVRLKHYIALCGARHNYKKMLDGCRTIASKVEKLKKALEDLGVEGPPTIKKCKKVKMQREEAREIAELDTSNIITLHGRPKRRATLPWHEQKEPPSSTYQHTLDSGSDSDQQKSHKIKRRTNWTNLQGIISDDAESD